MAKNGPAETAKGNQVDTVREAGSVGYGRQMYFRGYGMSIDDDYDDEYSDDI